jgi:beta-galactosidase
VTVGTERVSAPCFNDVLKITDGEEAGVYENNYYAGKTAVSVKNIGKGKVYYFGAAFSEDSARAFIELENIKPPMGIDNLINIPESIELAIRGDYIFLLNYSGEKTEMECFAPFKDMLSGREYSDKIVIDGYDAVALKRQEN